MSTTLLLCGDRAPEPVPGPMPGVAETVVLDQLCAYPKLIGDAAPATDRLVLGLCRGDYVLGQVQAQLRAAGFDPLGAPIIDLATTDPELFAIAAAGAAARADAFAGSRPEHAKLALPAAVNRRALLTGAAPAYMAAPAIDHDTCAAEGGCRACVETCPQQALSWDSAGVIGYDKVACQPCGRCVTVCPTGAIANPATTPAMVKAQVEAIVAAGGRSLAFACERGTPPPGPLVVVPCTGMITPAWVLSPLLLGAGSVSVLPCSATECPLGHDEIVHRVVDYAAHLLTALGDEADRVATQPLDGPPPPLPRRPLSDPFGPHGGAEVAVALAEALGATEVVVEHPAAPTGAIVIDPAACTGCTQCTRTCPTGALSLSEEGDGALAISFDGALCTACNQCIPRCPEVSHGAISLTPVTDVAGLRAGPRVIYEGTSQLCERCGAPIASVSVMDRIGELLGPEHAATMAVVSKRCVDCRGLG